MLGPVRDFFSNVPGSAAVVCSALLALIGTFLVIRNARNLARKQETIKMLMTNLWDQDYITAFTEFSRIRSDVIRYDRAVGSFAEIKRLKEADEWSSLTDEKRAGLEGSEKDFQTIRFILNHYELVSIGIREGIYDERIYRRWYHQSFVRDWQVSKLNIERMRAASALSDSSKLYSEYEDLAKRWAMEGPLRVKERHIRAFGGRTIILRNSK